ncbi:hypothetical protein H311_01597 [Anncaliia algerae PRA109]|nr:hypothetical protein H311_01597 [Anncaliia algerae PRA109]
MFNLNNKNQIPKIGLGTYKLNDQKILQKTIESAIEIGYRHIDTAYKYNNEEKIGIILKDMFHKNLIKRRELFITSKMWCTETEPLDALKESLKKLQLDYLDLYLIHFPVTFDLDEKKNPYFDNDGYYVTKEFEIEKIWSKMEELVGLGLVKSIGVSNFGINMLKRILKVCKIKPAVNQVEMHPYLQQKELFNFCKNNDIRIVAHSALGGSATKKGNEPELLRDPILLKIAQKYEVCASKIILSWLIQKGICIIPKTTKLNHLRENFFVIKLNENDIEEIENIKICYRFNHPTYFNINIYE